MSNLDVEHVTPQSLHGPNLRTLRKSPPKYRKSKNLSMSKISRETVRQTVDAQAQRQACTLLRRGRFAALGTIEAEDGAPSVSRVSLATAMDGSP